MAEPGIRGDARGVLEGAHDCGIVKAGGGVGHHREAREAELDHIEGVRIISDHCRESADISYESSVRENCLGDDFIILAAIRVLHMHISIQGLDNDGIIVLRAVTLASNADEEGRIGEHLKRGLCRSRGL